MPPEQSVLNRPGLRNFGLAVFGVNFVSNKWRYESKWARRVRNNFTWLTHYNGITGLMLFNCFRHILFTVWPFVLYSIAAATYHESCQLAVAATTDMGKHRSVTPLFRAFLTCTLHSESEFICHIYTRWMCATVPFIWNCASASVSRPCCCDCRLPCDNYNFVGCANFIVFFFLRFKLHSKELNGEWQQQQASEQYEWNYCQIFEMKWQCYSSLQNNLVFCL